MSVNVIQGRACANLSMTFVKLYSALDSRDTSRTSTPTLSISQRLLQGSASLVYDTSIWTSVCDMSVFEIEHLMNITFYLVGQNSNASGARCYCVLDGGDYRCAQGRSGNGGWIVYLPTLSFDGHHPLTGQWWICVRNTNIDNLIAGTKFASVRRAGTIDTSVPVPRTPVTSSGLFGLKSTLRSHVIFIAVLAVFRILAWLPRLTVVTRITRRKQCAR